MIFVYLLLGLFALAIGFICVWKQDLAWTFTDWANSLRNAYIARSTTWETVTKILGIICIGISLIFLFKAAKSFQKAHEAAVIDQKAQVTMPKRLR